MKKLILSITLLLTLIIPSSAFAENIKINVNNQEVKSDVSPYIENGRTMVPVRVITEYLGGNVYYMERGADAEAGYQYIDIASSDPADTGLTLIINKPVAFVSESAYRMESPAVIKNSRTFVPLRFLADYLRFNVNWDNNTKTVYITENAGDENYNFEKYYDESASKKLEKYIENPVKENYDKIFN